MKRAYKNEDITVYWDSDKCWHSGICLAGLPEVFNRAKRPWVNINAADAKVIRKVIDSCPSRALTYKWHSSE
jgi:uncharacterized Fe-S cluster protein YjdI